MFSKNNPNMFMPVLPICRCYTYSPTQIGQYFLFPYCLSSLSDHIACYIQIAKIILLIYGGSSCLPKSFLFVKIEIQGARGQFHQHILEAFSHEQDEELFLANGIRRINLVNFTLHIGQISLAQNVGEIEWQFFCQILTTLARGTKVVKIDPKWQNKIKLLFKRMVKDLKLTHKWKQKS